jgi:hypothetical protein
MAALSRYHDRLDRQASNASCAYLSTTAHHNLGDTRPDGHLSKLAERGRTGSNASASDTADPPNVSDRFPTSCLGVTLYITLGLQP